jgi:hypothetical protein
MKKSHLLLFVAFTSLGWTACSTTTTDDNENDNDTSVVMNADAPATGTRTVITELSESDQYVDLRTGKPIRIRRGESGLYMAESGDLDLFVNTTTGDTFYRGEAFPVSGHVMRDPGGSYTIDESWFNTQYSDTRSSDMGMGTDTDPDKMRVEDDGDYKMKNKDGDIKEKLKVDGDGKDMKYKYKDDENDTKVKMTEDQIKIKDQNGKTEIESDGSVKQKPR